MASSETELNGMSLNNNNNNNNNNNYIKFKFAIMTQAVNLKVTPEFTLNYVQEVVMCRNKKFGAHFMFSVRQLFYVLCIPITVEMTNTSREGRTSTARN